MLIDEFHKKFAFFALIYCQLIALALMLIDSISRLSYHKFTVSGEHV